MIFLRSKIYRSWPLNSLLLQPGVTVEPYPVSTAINNPRNNEPELIGPYAIGLAYCAV